MSDVRSPTAPVVAAGDALAGASPPPPGPVDPVPAGADRGTDAGRGAAAAAPGVAEYGAAGSLADALPDALLVCGPDGTVREVNSAAGALLGALAVAPTGGVRPAAVTAADVVGRRLTEVLPLQDDNGRDFWGCTAGLRALRTVTRFPERRWAVAGTGRAVLVTARCCRDATGTLTAVVLLLRDNAARERVERGRADLVSTVAHELRSPLTSVKGFTATLLAKWERFSDEQKKVMLETVNADADRVTRLLTELLDVSRIDAGRLELHRQVVDLPAVVRRAFDGRIAAGDKPDRFVLDVVGELPELWADRDKVEQVVANLVENALRHGDGTVSVVVTGSADGVTLAVTDQGDGVPPEIAQRIFSKFFRGKARRGGTGLGLYIVRGLAEAHGGGVHVDRAPGAGARFTVALPAGAPPYLAS